MENQGCGRLFVTLYVKDEGNEVNRLNMEIFIYKFLTLTGGCRTALDPLT